MLNVSETDTVLGTQRYDDAIGKGTLCGKLVEPRNRGFDGVASGSVLLGLRALPLAPARMRKPKRADHKRQSETLSDKRYQNYRECQKQNQVAIGKRVARRGCEWNGKGCRERNDSAHTRKGDNEGPLPWRRRIFPPNWREKPAGEISCRIVPNKPGHDHNGADDWDRDGE